MKTKIKHIDGQYALLARRKVIKKLEFLADKDQMHSSYYKATDWLFSNGYEHGSTAVMEPVAITKGEYNLPQKWHNISDKGRKIVDGYMEVCYEKTTIYLFK